MVDALRPICGHFENELTIVSIKISRTELCYEESTDISREDEMAVIATEDARMSALLRAKSIIRVVAPHFFFKWLLIQQGNRLEQLGYHVILQKPEEAVAA